MVVWSIVNFFSDILIRNLAESPFFRKSARFVNRNFSPKRDVLVKVKNHKMYANTIDRILALYLWRLSALGSFETKLMKKRIKRGMVIFDIGANIGYYSLILARFVGETGKVYAFEPDPENYRLLVKNIKTNGYKNIIAIQKAVSNKAGTINFYLSEEHRGDHRLYDSGDSRRVIKVKATTIDRFSNGKINPDVIKVDVQGAEFLVLLGMKKTIKRNKKIRIFCEFWPSSIRKTGYSPKDFLSYIKKQGFKLKLINEKKATIEEVDIIHLLKMCKGNKYTNLLLER